MPIEKENGYNPESSFTSRGSLRKFSILILGVLLFTACTPRDFLTRRLASDLIATSDTFRSPQTFQMRTGILSRKDYLSADYLALQRRGWISGTKATCPPSVESPCLDVTLTPAGVDAFQTLISSTQAERQAFTLPVARRQLVAVIAIAKHGSDADVDFTWRWIPLNEVGAALYPGDRRYHSLVVFRSYDDGWRVVVSAAHQSQPLDEALRDAEPAP
jgi:hypothetical protein